MEPAANRFALWQLAFRPGFLGAASLAVVAMVVWLLILEGALAWRHNYPAHWWHAHEMLFGFAMPVVVGFALTAVANWTGTKGTTGGRLLALFACWLAARGLLLSGLPGALPLAATADTLFIFGAAWELGSRVIATRQTRNYAFIPILLLLAALNLLSYLNNDQPLRSAEIHYAIIGLFLLLIAFVGGRVIPFFTSRRLDFEQPPLLPWLDYGSLGLLATIVGLAGTGLLLQDQTWIRGLLVLTAAVHLMRLWRWRGWQGLHEPLLWSLHLSYLFIPLGLMALALVLPDPAAARHVMHLLAIGAVAGMILSMIARVSLGHTGRPLQVSRLLSLSFGLLALAALARGVLPLLAPELTLWSWRVSGLCWIIAFSLFLIFYAKPLLLSRPDGKPG